MNARALDSGLLDSALHFERRLPALETTPLAKMAAKLRQRFGTLGGAKVDSNKLESAVRQAMADPGQLRSGQRLLLAFALSQPANALRGKSLLERESVLEPLLQLWENDARSGALKLSHWRGLFHSFMQASAGSAQERLGGLLKRTLEPAVRARKRPPAWLDGFRRHGQLLGPNPCAPYFDEMMAGKSDLLRDLRESAGVSIPPTSWFWQLLKEKAVSAIERMSDSMFRRSIELFIGLNELIPMSTDDLVKALIERYDASNERSPHQMLMDFALNAWGSPQLESKLHWKRCRKSARQMVCGWIAVQDLEEFYHLCKGDQVVDQRRLKFWLRFNRQMTYTQILLGGGMQDSRDRDIRKFIAEREKQGRLGSLSGSEIWNNAMLMQIGGWLFIEFSKIGTACRAIRIADREIETGQRSYSLSMLRHIGEQWVHLPNPGWEHKFLQKLGAMGITPDDGVLPRPGDSKHAARPAASMGSKKPPHPNPTVDLAALRAMGLRVVDNRKKGGALWAYPAAKTTGAALSTLASMGFKYMARKGAWYLS